MDISIGRLNITSFCADNIEHIKFIRELVSDENFQRFFPCLTEDCFQNKYIGDNQIQLKSDYLISEDKNLIGWVYLGGFDKDVCLDCAVHPQYRKRGYAPMIINECSNYLFENDIAQEMECLVRLDNTACINCLSKTKYKKHGKMDQFYIYKSYVGDYTENIV